MNHGQTENKYILPSIGFKDLLNAYPENSFIEQHVVSFLG